MGGPDRGNPGGHLSLLRSLRFVFNAIAAKEFYYNIH